MVIFVILNIFDIFVISCIFVIFAIFAILCYASHCYASNFFAFLPGYELSIDEEELPLQPADPADGVSALDDLQSQNGPPILQQPPALPPCSGTALLWSLCETFAFATSETVSIDSGNRLVQADLYKHILHICQLFYIFCTLIIFLFVTARIDRNRLPSPNRRLRSQGSQNW